MENYKKLGIVLAGGGAKGAYQIGVWEFLKQIGLDKYISCFSGASVGALNSVLMAASDLETAKKIWIEDNIKNKILPFDKEEFFKSVLKEIPRFRSNPLGWTINRLITIYEKGLFTRDGLKEIISKIDLTKIYSKGNPVFVAITKTNFKDVRYRDLYTMDQADIEDALLASSALPIVYPVANVTNSRYRDGGIKDNVPVKPIEENNATDIIVIYLDNSEKEVRKSETCELYNISPKASLASGKRPWFIPKDVYKFIRGTLDFDQKHLQQLYNQGYSDCKIYYSVILNKLLKKYED